MSTNMVLIFFPGHRDGNYSFNQMTWAVEKKLERLGAGTARYLQSLPSRALGISST